MNPLQTLTRQRLQLRITGLVQGVGFRPFVYTLATDLGLGGWVRNDRMGVTLEVEGAPSQLTQFLHQLDRDRPPHAVLAQIEQQTIAPQGEMTFRIQASNAEVEAIAPAPAPAWILPDLAICADCRRELVDPDHRRYHYPFINCTHCGPRHSILTALPYDRPHTTMQGFTMCPDCQREYDDPRDRRFHAQPNACPQCGPRLALWDAQGQAIAPVGETDTIIAHVVERLRHGEIVALKGLGGFHLMVDAHQEAAVQRLRQRKHRPTKPLAVMYPSLAAIRQDCDVSAAAANILTATMAPIVLLPRRSGRLFTLAPSLAPHHTTLGVMLPYTPLHHLLLAALGTPVVATSGNPAHAPICIDEIQALQELSGIADVFLVHDRPIVRPLDDTVVRCIQGRPLILRRGRGVTPNLAYSLPGVSALLAVGGHLKNTLALALPGQLRLSPHLGDLNGAATVARWQETLGQLLHLSGLEATAPAVQAIACDAHPDYVSSQRAKVWGMQWQVPVIPVQHHYAHVLSGMVDNQLAPPVLGIAWDGTGYGLDGQLWGGEGLIVRESPGFERRAHLRPFPLPGGEQAILEPRRAALGLLYAAWGDHLFAQDWPILSAFTPHELTVLRTMLERRINCPLTTSVGRLFDAIAAIIGLCTHVSFEGEAAMRLENTLPALPTTATYPYTTYTAPSGALVLDWEPLLTAILATAPVTPTVLGAIAAQFHNTLVDMILAIAAAGDCSQVLLTGGCFQNRYLLEQAIVALRAAGYRPYWHHQIPPNDGGLAVGQLLGAARVIAQGGATTGATT